MRPRTARRTLIIDGLAILVIAIILEIGLLDSFHDIRERLDAAAYDLRIRALTPDTIPPDPRVVILDIDEKSLRQEGHWPWPRTKVATLIERVFEHGAAVIGFDVVFAEPDLNPLLETAGILSAGDPDAKPSFINDLERIGATFDPDAGFASALSQGMSVMGYTFSDKAGQPVGALPAALGEAEAMGLSETALFTRGSYIGNLPNLQANAASAGFFSLEPDTDGIIRRVPLLARFEDKVYSALALEVARHYLGAPPVTVDVRRAGNRDIIENISLAGMINIPTDERGQVLVPFRSRFGGFTRVPATDVLQSKINDEVFSDAIVLVGTSAAGLVDLRAAPVLSIYPGIEIHANIISAILDETFPYEPAWARGVDLSIMVLLGLILVFVFPRLGAMALLLTTAAIVGLYAAAYVGIWHYLGLNVSVTIPVLMVLLLSTVNMTYGFLIERRGRESLKDMFGQYVPPAVVDQISNEPERSHGFEGESRELTVLFSDIRDFTTLSEKLEANELKRMLNFYFTEMTAIIFENQGTIDKYVGDMVMAFWGAPLRDNEHRAHGLDTALAMKARLAALQPELAKRNWPAIRIGIGLNSGSMNVGDMGSTFRRSYTVIGDAVNLGSRLEGLSKYYGVEIVVSEYTRNGQDQYLFRELDLVRVKGKEQAVRIFEPLGLKEALPAALREEVDAYHEALSHYYARRWAEASAGINALIAQAPQNKLYRIYQERIAELSDQGLTEDWNGVYTHKSK